MMKLKMMVTQEKLEKVSFFLLLPLLKQDETS